MSSHVLKNFAAVADAPLSTHTLPYLSQMLTGKANSERLFIAAQRHTGASYSATIYDVTNHRLYRALPETSIRGWLNALAAERENLLVLKADEILHLEIYEDKNVTTPRFLAN